jgi:serine phosphatase RsbU (regulator of sigma subunit)
MKPMIVNSLKKIFNKTTLINMAIIIPMAIAIFVGMILHLSNSINNLSHENIENTTLRTCEKLESFFDPVKKHIHIANQWSKVEYYDSLGILAFNNRYIPILKFYQEISGIIIADTRGVEYSLIKNNDTLINRIIKQSAGKKEIIRMKWSYDNNLNGTLIKEWHDELQYDPRKRLWFIGALGSNRDEIFWSDPYTFFTSKNPGITASLICKASKSGKVNRILAFDVLLTEISKFTKSLKVSKNGLAFIVSSKGEVIGLPRNKRFDNPDSLKHYVLKPVDSIGIPAVSKAYHHWKQSDVKNETFRFVSERQNWRAGFHSFALGTNNSFIIGVIVPESDLMGELRKTQLVILVGFFVVLILIFIVIRNYNQKKNANKLLIIKNLEIEAQRDKIETQRDKILKQQKSITSSIEYAKRIQTAVLPPTDYLDKCMPEHFVLFKPRDIVSGDFYWIKKIKKYLIIAAADCTGHGVPGAFMSMLGVAFLNEITTRQDVTSANQVLDRLRTYIKTSLRQSGKRYESPDGMDIALCVVDTETRKLQFAGAYIPLYFIRDNKLNILKPDIMPIGYFRKEKQFSNQEIQMMPADIFYIFSDGYFDQFGGENHTKFNLEKFKHLFIEIHRKPMSQQKEILEKTIEEWKGNNDQIDDILIIGFKI